MADQDRARRWRQDHPEKVRQYNRDYLRRKYLADFLKECEKTGKNVKNQEEFRELFDDLREFEGRMKTDVLFHDTNAVSSETSGQL